MEGLLIKVGIDKISTILYSLCTSKNFLNYLYGTETDDQAAV